MHDLTLYAGAGLTGIMFIGIIIGLSNLK